MSAFQKRAIQKAAAFAAAYGMGTQRAVASGGILGTAVSMGFFDDLARYAGTRDPWVVAISQIIGDTRAWTSASPAERAAMEERYQALATKRTPDGRRAAKVVAIVVAEQLAPQTNSGMAFDLEAGGMGFEFKTGPQHDDHMDAVRQQMAAYRKMFGAP